MKDIFLDKKNNKGNIKLNTWLLPILGVLFFILYLMSGFKGWLIFFVGFTCLGLISLSWVIALRRNLHVERKLHLAWAKVGDSVQEELKLMNEGWFPATWVEISDSSEALSASINFVSDIGARSLRTRYFSHQCKQRGLYTLGPTCLRTGDPFGVFTLTVENRSTETILVTPPLVHLERLNNVPAGLGGDRQPKRLALEKMISDGGVREYHPGDSLRRVHWSASAHMDKLVVRRLEASTSGDWWIYLDLDEFVQRGEGLASTLELAIIAAASFAIQRLNRNSKVGLAFSGPGFFRLQPSSGSAHRWRILKALAMAKSGDTPLRNLLRMHSTSQIASMIIVTPSTNPEWIGAVSGISQRGIYSFLINPNEFDNRYDQRELISSLAAAGIPFQQIPRSVLEKAYQPSAQEKFSPGKDTYTGIRYLQRERSSWMRM